MAWTPPTAAEFKARLPAFATVDDGVVEEAISEAGNAVDESWIDESEFVQGIRLHAAHTLTLDGHGSGADAKMARAGASGFKTMKSGTLTLEQFGKPNGADDGDTLSTTFYGRRFLERVALNCPGVAVV